MNEWCGWPVVPETTAWEAAQQILTDAESNQYGVRTLIEGIVQSELFQTK